MITQSEYNFSPVYMLHILPTTFLMKEWGQDRRICFFFMLGVKVLMVFYLRETNFCPLRYHS